MANTIVFDCEILGGRFLFKGRVLENRNIVSISLDEQDSVRRLYEVMNSGCTFVSFNGIKFDAPIIAAVLAGKDAHTVKMIANSIIENEMQPWEVERRFGLVIPKFDHIDLIEVAPSFVGLKAYGARMHMPWLQDLPFNHDVVSLTDEEWAMVDRYCENDLDTTEELMNRLEEQLKLRLSMSKEYGLDLRSKSDTQMAETALIKRVGIKRGKVCIPPFVTYKAPAYLAFESPHLHVLSQRITETEYHVNQKTGHVELPEFLSKELVKLNAGTYQLGVGGIHSTHDKKVCHVEDQETIITDIDAASYYPSIWVKWGVYLENTNKELTDEYQTIYYRRLEAKAGGDKQLAENLKVPLNGSFGKLLSRWSPLYNPELGLFITLTGQLTLLMLIEQLEKVGAVALSANTDGIAMAYPKRLKETVERVVSEFSERSKFDFEYTPYRVLAMKDVNSYFAVKSDRSIKAKGIYAPLDLKKNPTSPVCAFAVGEWLAKGIPFIDTITRSPFTEFISARSVTGGGVQGDKYLGRVVRWYQTTDESLPPLTYMKNGNQVPKTIGARACMTLLDKINCPEDLDYNWYLQESVIIAHNCGCGTWLDPKEVEAAFKSRKKKVPK